MKRRNFRHQNGKRQKIEIKRKNTPDEIRERKRVRLGDNAKFIGYGNWCGPGWSAGEAKDAKELTEADKKVPAVNALDQACKNHDIDIAEAKTGQDIKDADTRFISAAGEEGFTGKAFAYLVEHYGPSKQILDSGFITPVDRKRKRGIDQPTIRPVKTKLAQRQESLSLLPGPGSMGDVAMKESSSSASTGAKETPVDDPYVVYRGPPDYTFASLPYNFDLIWNNDTASAGDLSFRLTSPYQINHASIGSDATNIYQDRNIGAGTIQYAKMMVDSNAGTANWFNYYASLYKYYHVMGCRWTATIENLGPEHLWVYQTYCSDDTPPPASNLDMQLWPDIKYYNLSAAYNQLADAGGQTNRRLQAPLEFLGQDQNVENAAPDYSGSTNTSTPFSSKGKSFIQLSGEYKPGQFGREIIQDEDVTTWTRTNANPSLFERLFFRIQQHGNSRFDATISTGDNLDSPISVRIRVSFQYLTEFKELDKRLKWPVNRNPIEVRYISAASNYDTGTFNQASGNENVVDQNTNN